VPHAGEHVLPFCVTVHDAPLFVGSLLIVALYCKLALIGMSAEAGVTVMVMARTVMGALPDTLVSATDVAVTVTSSSLTGGVGGALYVTDVLVAFVRVPAPVVGDMDHVTPWFEGSLLTVAVNASVPPACMLPFPPIEICIAEKVRVSALDLEWSATAVAVMVTGTSLAGGVGGAL
jgi:hypothetical protein